MIGCYDDSSSSAVGFSPIGFTAQALAGVDGVCDEISIAAGAVRATMQQTRAAVLLMVQRQQLTSDVNSESGVALGSAFAHAMLDLVIAANDNFPKWWLPNTGGARRHLRCWQALALISPQMVHLAVDVRAKANCVWELLRGRQLAVVRQYMERVAVSLVLSAQADAAATLITALSDFSLKRDPASSMVLVARFSLLPTESGLPSLARSVAIRACVPLLLGWATSNFHTVRLQSWPLHTSPLSRCGTTLLSAQ